MTTTSCSLNVKLGRWDQVGVWVSTLCAIHCLVAPLVFLALPAFSGIWEHPASHAVMALLVLPLAAIVLLRGYRIHRKRWIAATAAVGIVCIVVGCLLPLVGGPQGLAELLGLEGWGAGDLGAAGASSGASSGASEVASQADSCADCCPQVVVNEDGGRDIGWPAASVASISGSVLLAAGHFGNILSRRCC